MVMNHIARSMQTVLIERRRVGSFSLPVTRGWTPWQVDLGVDVTPAGSSEGRCRPAVARVKKRCKGERHACARCDSADLCCALNIGILWTIEIVVLIIGVIVQRIWNLVEEDRIERR
jgi:hypothetical protein